jgi:hypothetical protein
VFARAFPAAQRAAFGIARRALVRANVKSDNQMDARAFDCGVRSPFLLDWSY